MSGSMFHTGNYFRIHINFKLMFLLCYHVTQRSSHSYAAQWFLFGDQIQAGSLRMPHYATEHFSLFKFVVLLFMAHSCFLSSVCSSYQVQMNKCLSGEDGNMRIHRTVILIANISMQN